MSYPLSLASYSFHGLLAEGRLDVFGYIRLAFDRYHVSNADIWSGFLPSLDADFLKKVRKTLDERGMALANLCVDGPHLWRDSAEERAEHKTKMKEYIRAAEILGARTVRIDFGGDDKVEMPEEAFDYLVSTYQEYCDLADGFGAKIGPENHWGWDRVPKNLKRVKEAVARKNYGHLYHFGNFAPDPDIDANALAISYAMHTHIPANSLDFAAGVMKQLNDSGYAGTYSIEHHSGEHEEARVEWQLASVRKFVAELEA